MSVGTLYGIGVGPGDPELLTVKGSRIIGECPNIFVPKARIKSESLARKIAEQFINGNSRIHELVFPMVTDKTKLKEKWDASAKTISEVLLNGEDAVFLTLGDSLLYSTYIYMLRSLKEIIPDVKVVTVPGVAAFSAVASLTDFPVGVGKRKITIVPTSDDMSKVEQAVTDEGTVILMKIGSRIHNILDILDKYDLLDKSVFVANAGLETEKISTDLRALREETGDGAYLAVILVDTGK